MQNNEVIDKLIEYRFMDPIWGKVANHIVKPLLKDDEELIKVFLLYYVYISNGSTCMPVDKSILNCEWLNKCNSIKVLLTSNIEENEEIDKINKEIDELYSSIYYEINNISKLYDLDNLIGDRKLFIIENDYLYSRVFYESKLNIKNSIESLFNSYSDKDIKLDSIYNIKEVWGKAKDKQIEVIRKGLSKNLIVTGGPGTGKTTTIFYLLLALLKIHPDYEVYLTAPSGKAADRVKESIAEAISDFEKLGLKDFDREIEKLKIVKRYTIHGLLGIDYDNNGFNKNINNQFDSKSIFIIDEASMIDINLFSSLLSAIKVGSRVFILGDKDQLPSVDAGAVLSDLLDIDNVIELDESNRFKNGSEIYDLASNVRTGNEIKSINFIDCTSFNIPEDLTNYPVLYVNDELNGNKKDNFDTLINTWSKFNYKDLQSICTNVKLDNEELNKIINKINLTRILCAENDGYRGVNTINKLMIDKVIDKKNQSKIKGYYPGIPLMITENNKELDLNNGDTGVVITLEGSDQLYFLIKKNNDYYKVDTNYPVDKIFKYKDFMLYPLRMLDLKKVTYCYAMTIHKSQGSGYKYIMVILPKKHGHPLLNRQILYTAITRTKGLTLILSDLDRINEAISKNLIRYTNIFK